MRAMGHACHVPTRYNELAALKGCFNRCGDVDVADIKERCSSTAVAASGAGFLLPTFFAEPKAIWRAANKERFKQVC